MNKPEQTKTVDVTWVLVAAALLLAGVVGYSIRVMMVEERAVEQQQAERAAAEQRRLQHLVDGIEEGPAEMLIDFGDIQLNCAKQNLLGYDVIDPDGYIVVAQDVVTFTRPVGGPSGSFYCLSKPIENATDNTMAEIGCQFDVVVQGIPDDFSFGIWGAEGVVLSTGLWDALVEPRKLAMLYRTTSSEGMALDEGSLYTVQIARYKYDTGYRQVMQIIDEGVVVNRIETSDSDASDWLGYSSVVFCPMRISWGTWVLNTTVTVSNVYVSGASPVLPQIRNTPNLGKLLIRPGGNT